MAEDVTIYVTDAFPAGNPISGVYVGIHNSATKVLVQSGLSDASGMVLFPAVDETLNSGVYELRIAPNIPGEVVGGSVKSITVLAAPVSPLSNIFDVTVTPEGYTSAPNPRLCRCQGYFVDSTGKARKNLSLSFSEYDLRELEYIASATIDVKGVVPSKIVAVTDANGYMAIDLYRGGCYLLYMEGFESQGRVIKIPDLPSANIADIVFPTVGTVEYYDTSVKILPVNAPTTTVATGADKTLDVEVLLRSGVITEGDQVTFVSSNTAVATVGYSASDKQLVITGVAAGSANITPSRVTLTDGGVKILPEPAVIGVLAVTVT